MALDELAFYDIGTAGNGNWGTRIKLTYVAGPAGFSAIFYQCKMVEDIDGAPTCYAPPGSGLAGLDALPNAASDPAVVRHNLQLLAHPPPHPPGAPVAADPFNHNFEWRGLFSATPAQAGANPPLVTDQRLALRDRRGRFPAVQQAGQPAPGFYVSASATAANPALRDWDQRKYWDATGIAYCALTPALSQFTRPTKLPGDVDFPHGVVYGDFGLAIRNGTGVNAGFFFADWGNHAKVGESSRRLFRTLFPQADNEHGVTFIVFPGSGSGPRPTQGMVTAALKIQMATLSLASNAERLLSFLANGADLAALERIRPIAEQDAFEFRARQYENLRQALTSWGYRPPIGDFPVGHPASATAA